MNERIRTMMILAVGAFALGLLGRAYGADANPPELMTYQGYLVDGDGDALGDTAPVNHDVVFRIYDAKSEGNKLWSEQQTVTVDKGYFSVLLGQGVKYQNEERGEFLSAVFNGADASDRFIGITVASLGGGDVEIAPRLRLVSSPFAYMATQARRVTDGSGHDNFFKDGAALKLGAGETPTLILPEAGGATLSGKLTLDLSGYEEGLQIDNGGGTTTLGAGSENFFHVNTELPSFYFNKSIYVNGDLHSYNRDTIIGPSDNQDTYLKLFSGSDDIHAYADNFYFRGAKDLKVEIEAGSVDFRTTAPGFFMDKPLEIGGGSGSPLKLSMTGGGYGNDSTSGFIISNEGTGRATQRIRTVNNAPAELFFDSNGAARWDISCRHSGNNYDLMFYGQADPPSYGAVGGPRMVLTQAGWLGVGVGNTPRNSIHAGNGLTVSGAIVSGSTRTAVIRLGNPYTNNHDAYCAKITASNTQGSNYNSDLRFYTSYGNHSSAALRMAILAGDNHLVIQDYGSDGVTIRNQTDNGGAIGTSSCEWDDGYITELWANLQSSDRRIKRDITPVRRNEILEMIDEMSFYQYRLKFPREEKMKGQGRDADGLFYGVVAQELREVYPNVVKSSGLAAELDENETDEDEIQKNRWYVEKARLAELALGGIKDLHALAREREVEIDSLRGRNRELEAEMETLQDEVALLKASLSRLEEQVGKMGPGL